MLEAEAWQWGNTGCGRGGGGKLKQSGLVSTGRD